MQDDGTERYGGLVGWNSQDFGEHLVLTLQTYERETWDAGEEPLRTSVLMTKSQAAVLANDLLKAAGTTSPSGPRGWLASLFR